ncbi:WD40 repeat-like protein [Myriangium duriaei CBS 260.36]|uniref:WD40 repeat-like protein n=1 Tax=Myriangium duriaei CBS 260.36 TaxID=1168546 RepID=A0A9P4J212_9PEZI|nr:WD40 repeat-like protein [Myriangium duriaei CBS 260.36]
MVKSYRRYEYTASFGVVTSSNSNIIWTDAPAYGSAAQQTGVGRAYVGANEEVLCWDVKKGELLSRWRDKDCNSEVTALAQCPSQPEIVAVGHADGSTRIWDDLSATVLVTFNGHRSAITHLAFDREGLRLASGSRDTDIIIWNLLSESAEFRLRGHKEQITGLSFLCTPSRLVTDESRGSTTGGDDIDDSPQLEERFLLSTSKDALVKLWDLSTPQCIETRAAQTNGECWALGLSPDGTSCVTAGNDGEMKVWALDVESLSAYGQSSTVGSKKQFLRDMGVLLRNNKDRTTEVTFHPTASYVAFHGSEKAIEIFRIRTADEVRRALVRKRKRRKEKATLNGEDKQDDEESSVPQVTDIFIPHVIVRTGGRVRSAVWATKKKAKALSLLVGTNNNQLEMFDVEARQEKFKQSAEEGPEYSRSLGVDMPGHRADIRALAISSDDRMLASASAGQLKIWNVKTQTCLRTLECGQSLCCTFLPGDKIVLLGTKTGELELYDIASSTLIDKFEAHTGAVWSLQVHPDGRSVVTGGADKSAKFWNFDIVQEEIPGTKRTKSQLRLTQTRALKVADDILSLCFSPDARLLALSTLDNTVKVFFVDSLKLFLTLYGHKLPVLSMSISSDSKLIATSSADKNVRLWGLDFGDCHKAFFAHQDSVMQVLFIPHPVENDEKHIFFSAGKDSAVKSWDGDKFEQVQKMESHHGEVWAMALSRTGEKVITASHDKSIRIWDVGDDLIFLEEEREREMEQSYEATLAAQMDKDLLDDEQNGDGQEVAAATKQTITTLTYGERIMEALEVGKEDRLVVEEWEKVKQSNANAAPPQRNPLFMALGGISAEQHVLNTIAKVPTASLNDALLLIPFSTLPTLFSFLASFFQQKMKPELAWKVFYFLLQAHNTQLVASKQLKNVMSDISSAYGKWVKEEKQVYGFNAAALTVMGRQVREGEAKGLEDDEAERQREERGRKKRAYGAVA